jgi:hypothetical protein
LRKWAMAGAWQIRVQIELSYVDMADVDILNVDDNKDMNKVKTTSM